MAVDAAGFFRHLQTLVHGTGCTLVLPGLLVVVSAGLLAYRNVTEGNLDTPLNGFLANILLQMLPLVALKAKIWSCTDRVSLVPLVLAKTLSMHLTLGLLRLISQAIMQERVNRLAFGCDATLVLAVAAILRLVFDSPLSPQLLLQHRDVRNLVGLAMLAAVASEAFFVYVQPWWMSQSSRLYAQDGLVASKVFFVAANYVDIVAFMPVVWRLYQVEDDLEDCSVGLLVSDEGRRQIRYFFAFVTAFYLWDDVLDPVMNLLDEPLAMMAHAAHFMLLIDFAGFFLFQVTTPAGGKEPPERSEQLQGLLAEDEDD